MPQKPTPPFRLQRLLCYAIVLGATMFAVVAGFVVQSNDGRGLLDQPIAQLDLITWLIGGTTMLSALLLRVLLSRRADLLPADQRGTARFQSRLLPTLALETGALFAVVGWMLQGDSWPYLAIAGALLVAAIVQIPMHDVDADPPA